MKKTYNRIRRTGLKASKIITKRSQDSLNYISNVTNNSINQMSKGSKKIKDYFNSDLYEQDLDELIALIHAHNSDSKPDFTKFKNRKRRVLEKTNYLHFQAFLLVTTAGATGSAVGNYFGSPENGIMIGTAVGILVIGFYAGKIIIKRTTEDNDGLIFI